MDPIIRKYLKTRRIILIVLGFCVFSCLLFMVIFWVIYLIKCDIPDKKIRDFSDMYIISGLITLFVDSIFIVCIAYDT